MNGYCSSGRNAKLSWTGERSAQEFEPRPTRCERRERIVELHETNFTGSAGYSIRYEMDRTLLDHRRVDARSGRMTPPFGRESPDWMASTTSLLAGTALPLDPRGEVTMARKFSVDTKNPKAIDTLQTGTVWVMKKLAEGGVPYDRHHSDRLGLAIPWPMATSISTGIYRRTMIWPMPRTRGTGG